MYAIRSYYATRGFCYSTSDCPTIADNVVNEAGTYTAETFNLSATGLTGNTTYYYRSYATNAQGTSYGEIQTFSTLSLREINITGNSVSIVDGDLTPDLADYTNFGSTRVMSNLARTFTIVITSYSIHYTKLYDLRQDRH